MLDIIESELDKLGMESFKITGSTPAKERQDMTTAFNDGQRSAFLISLKAGGVGLNLTGADTVILVDLWWNPAVEAQAIGRAHRIGQERNVEVYRRLRGVRLRRRYRSCRRASAIWFRLFSTEQKPNPVSLWRKFEKFWEFRQNSLKIA